MFYCVLDAAGAVRCAGYEIHIGFLSVYDAVRYDFGTVEECLVIFVFQNQYRFDRLILQGYRHFDVSLETGGRSVINSVLIRKTSLGCRRVVIVLAVILTVVSVVCIALASSVCTGRPVHCRLT